MSNISIADEVTQFLQDSTLASGAETTMYVDVTELRILELTNRTKSPKLNRDYFKCHLMDN